MSGEQEYYCAKCDLHWEQEGWMKYEGCPNCRGIRGTPRWVAEQEKASSPKDAEYVLERVSSPATSVPASPAPPSSPSPLVSVEEWTESDVHNLCVDGGIGDTDAQRVANVINASLASLTERLESEYQQSGLLLEKLQEQRVEVASLTSRLAEAEKEKTRLRGEIRKAIADWHRFQDFIVAEGPMEMFRLTDAGTKVKGVIEKFMRYISMLWKENSDLRSSLAVAEAKISGITDAP